MRTTPDLAPWNHGYGHLQEEPSGNNAVMEATADPENSLQGMFRVLFSTSFLGKMIYVLGFSIKEQNR